jgi:hypothetical protein
MEYVFHILLTSKCRDIIWWRLKHEQINKIEYFVNIERILEKYSLTHDIQYIMMWRNIYHVYMDEQ